MKTNKKNNLLTVASLIASALPLMMMALPAAYAQPEDVKVALIVPLSGPWARNGELQRKGAEMAIDDINAAGGIKALGGAKMRLVVADTGDSVEKAKNAIQRLLSQEPNLIGGSGAFLSSLTLAVTEVSERAELPWLSLSYGDQITGRGFKYVFQTSPVASVQAATVLPILVKLSNDSTGKPPKSAGIVMDNTASPASFTKGMRDTGFAKYGINLVTDQVYTPPLADATSVVQKLRNTRPDLAFMLTTNVPDTKLLLEKMNEMGVGSGKIPVVTNGGHMGAPELLKVVKKEMLEGVMVVVANWGGKGDEKLENLFKKRTGEPWMTQDSLSTYGDMWIFKDALEKAGVADRKKVAAAIRAMDTSEGAAKYFAGGHLKFDEQGRRVGSEIVILQWRNGVPIPVYPASLAVAKPVWPKQP
ncbi:ABC transporter substrate-binding protein [Glaciimonas sp. PAMC28666]|uniref:ABC transporter substrate-binding protein n=1 Tax=Glaciimonas sp. PAMC28666 TaxID=2807626 RepID=UPI001966191D|nr:ABC transporter substrate-binding protein [Glaciimonas sp. PAMC28666]QRX83711.1 ABC transporter substrate-binding protein [Glaciimonas sp. PAMC28666]